MQWLIRGNVTEDHFVTMVSEVEGKIKIFKKTFEMVNSHHVVFFFRNSLFHYLRARVVSKSNHTKNAKDIFVTQTLSICQEIFSLYVNKSRYKQWVVTPHFSTVQKSIRKKSKNRKKKKILTQIIEKAFR